MFCSICLRHLPTWTTKNPRIFLSLEGVTPLQQRTSTLITYCHCFSWTHKDAVEDCPCTCGHALTYQALTDPSTFWSSALTSRSELYYSFFPFTSPHVPIFSLKHTHYAKITEPRGVQVINHTLCQNQPDFGFWAIQVGPNDLYKSVLRLVAQSCLTLRPHGL